MIVGDILHIIVSCCLEETRLEVLKECIDSIKCRLPREDVYAIDNCSTVEGVTELLRSVTDHVCVLDKNYGYWGALWYALQNYKQSCRGNYSYVYIIESDMVHTGYERIAEAQAFLDDPLNWDVASVRLQEFSVEESHLYDKELQRPDSRRWAWTRLSNHFTGKKAHFSPTTYPGVWRTNLAPQLPALNRIGRVQFAFEELKKMSEYVGISEADFQRFFSLGYKETALLDGGIYNCKSSYERSVTGSYTNPAKLAELGYRPTRADRIDSRILAKERL